MRDIEKDKASVEDLAHEHIWLAVIARAWIAQYEAAQARISELEAQLHPNNRKDVTSRPAHDTMLASFFQELSEVKR